MEMPSILQGESVTRLLQGAAVGAIAAVAIGFGWGGWMLGGTAARQAEDGAKKAVVAVLAPICVDKFQRAADLPSNIEQFRKTASYAQADFVEKGGWATLPGNDKANSAVAQACATILGTP